MLEFLSLSCPIDTRENKRVFSWRFGILGYVFVFNLPLALLFRFKVHQGLFLNGSVRTEGYNL
jgi:hypothetical protein